MAVDLEHEFVSADGWPRDLQAFAMASLLWGGFLLVRAIFALRAGAPAVPFEDVFLGVKFYGDHARLTMALQAIIFVTFAIGILMHKRWGLILALLYMAQVIIGPRDLHSLESGSRVAAYPCKDRIDRKPCRPADSAVRLVPRPPALTSTC